MLAGCADTGIDDPAARTAEFQQGVRLYDQGRYTEAYKIFNDLSYVDAAAARNVGIMLRKGQGVAKDPKKAEVMFAYAAQGGLATAAADLGEMLLDGEAGKPDPHDALAWLTIAADAHHSIAEYHLGTMYETGNTVPRDLKKAELYYTESAAGGDAQARARLVALGITPPPAPPQFRREAPEG